MPFFLACLVLSACAVFVVADVDEFHAGTKRALDLTHQEQSRSNAVTGEVVGVSPTAANAKGCFLDEKNKEGINVDNGRVVNFNIRHTKFKTDVLVSKIVYEVFVSPIEFPTDILIWSETNDGEGDGQFINQSSWGICGQHTFRTVLNSQPISLSWTLHHISQPQTNVTFKLQYKVPSDPQVYQIVIKKPITKDCNLWLSSDKSNLASDDISPVEDCQIWLLDHRIKKGMVVELSRLNVPCSRGFLLFSGVQSHYARNKRQRKLCGKIEEVPITERNVYFSPSSFPSTLNIRGNPVFSLTYGLVDQCYNLTFLTKNGSYHLYATPELECTFKIHLPYGNRIVLNLETGNASLSSCKGILTEVSDGKSSWVYCTESELKGESNVEIVSSENMLEIKISTIGLKSDGLEFKMSYVAEPIDEIVGTCKFGWISLNHMCVTVVEMNKVTWMEAEKECVDMGGHLASITSDFTESVIENLIMNSPGYQETSAFWIGATDKVHEGDFRWSDGSPFAYANWFPGWSQYNRYNRQPNDDGLSEQDCIELRRMFSLPNGGAQITSFMWNDRDCAALNYFVCEKYQNEDSVMDPWRTECNKSVVLTQQHPSAVITSPGFPSPYPDNIECITEITAPSAYRLVLDFEELVLEDEPTCSYDYLEIMEPSNGNESANITTEVPKPSQRLCSDWSSKLKLLRHTSSGSKMILHFSTDYSNHFGGFKARVSMRNVKQCHDDRLFSFQDSCYLVVSYPEVTWSTAGHICEGIKAQLASVLSSEEEDFVSATIRKNAQYRPGTLYWLGSIEDVNSRFVWVDGKPMIYANWFPPTRVTTRAKNITEKRQYCLSIQWTPSQSPSYPSGLYWRSHKCNINGGYVCKRPKEDLSELKNFNRTVNGTRGQISTPNFPDNYRNDLEFSINIIAPPRSRIVIEFERLDLEYQQACLYDYIELISIKGGQKDPNTNVRLCGSYEIDMHRFDYVSSGNEMIVTFHSDYSISGTGFSLKWKAVDISACPFQTLTSNEGVIISPNFPFSILPNLNCSITVLAPTKKRVWLEFLHFDIYDNLQPENSLSPSEPVSVEVDLGKELTIIKPYQNENLITEGAFVSSGETLKINFRTSDSPTGKGFKARYRIVDPVEEKRVIKLRPETAGALRHLNYPAAPPGNINFLQHLVAPVGHVISLELYNVKLKESECSDERGLVEVYDMYADTNGTLWKLCFEEAVTKSPMAITSYVNTLCFRQKSGPLGFPFNGSLKIHNDSNFKEKLRKHHQSAVDFCEPNPCENDAKCVSNANKNYCQCIGHFAGLFCGLTKCELNPCIFGSCELTATNYKCHCEQGYNGQNCESKQKPCENNPCENRGVCIERGSNFHCQCHAWWEGARCDKRMLHIPYKPLSQRMLEEPFWLGLITVTVVMGVIGLFWCAKRHFPEKIEKLLAEESERSRSNLPSLRTSLREQLAASSASTVTVIPSPGSGNPRTLLGRLGIRKPSILSLTSPRQNGYSPATARTFSLDDLLKPVRRTPSPRKRNNSTPTKKNNAEKKHILQHLITPTGTQQAAKETIQMSEKIEPKTQDKISDVKETKLTDSSGNVGDQKMEKKVTFARLLNKISAEMNSASDVEMGILKSGKIASAFTRSSSTPPSPATEMRSPNSTSSNQGSDTFSSSDLAIPSTLNFNLSDLFSGRKHSNLSKNRQKPASADSILAMFRNFSNASSPNNNWPSSLKPSPSTTPTISSPQDDYAIDEDSTSSVNTPISYASVTMDSPSKHTKMSGTIDVPVFDALSAQKCTSGSGSNLLHPPTILLEIPSTINKCLSPIREMPTPLPSPMPSPAITPIMHRSKASSLNEMYNDSSDDRITIDIPNNYVSDDDDFRCNKDIVIDPQAEDGLIQEEAAALQLQSAKGSDVTCQIEPAPTPPVSTTQNHPLVIPMLTVQLPSPTRQPLPRLVLGSPPPQRSPFINVEECSDKESGDCRKSLKDLDKPSSLDLMCTPPMITITCNMSEIESDAESISPAIKKTHHLGSGTSTMCYLSPFALGQRNDRTVSESNLSSSGYSSMASPGSSRCGSSNPLCPSELDDPNLHAYHPILGQRICRLKSVPPLENFQKPNDVRVGAREISDSETLSDDPLVESNDEGIGTDHIDEKIDEGELKSAKELEVFITSDCDSTKTILKVPSITNLSAKCCGLETTMDLLMPPSSKKSLNLPSIVIQSDTSLCEKHLSPVSSRSESPLSDKTTGIDRFSPQFYSRNKDSLPFTDSDGLYDFPSIDKMNLTSCAQPCRKFTTRRKEKRMSRIQKLPSPTHKSPTATSPLQNLDVPGKESTFRVHPPRKSSPKRKLRGQQIVSSSSSSESLISPNSKVKSPMSCSEDVRWSYSNEEWSDSRHQKTSDDETRDVTKRLRDYPKSSEDLTKPKRISRLRAISHQIRFLRRLELSLRRRERTVSPSESFESEEDSPRVTSPLIQPSEKLNIEIRKSKSINFNQPVVKNRRYKKEDTFTKDKMQFKRVYITGNGYSD